VFKDDEMPVEKVDTGQIQVTKIDGDDLVGADGKIDLSKITGIQAQKWGGQVDEVLKEEREAAHQAEVDKLKDGRRSFDPADFAAVLRGDGSADAVVNVTGDDRMRREAKTRPSLSEAAEEARRVHQEELAAASERAARASKAEEEIRSKKERDAGIFRGAAIDADGQMPFEELPEVLRGELEEMGLKQDSYGVKNYPYNSEVAGRILLPYDVTKSRGGYRVMGGDNIDIEGTVQLGDGAVAVISKKDKDQEALVIYGRRREGEDKVEIGLIRVR
jgi:hypothetical protein